MLTYATGAFPGLCFIYGSVLEGISGVLKTPQGTLQLSL